MSENEIAKITVNLCIKIHKKLGPGLLESVYQNVLEYEFAKLSIPFSRQPVIDINYENLHLPNAFRADIIVENKVILELKSVSEISAVHFKTLLTYLRLTNIKLGLLINFNEVLIKDGINRVVNNL